MGGFPLIFVLAAVLLPSVRSCDWLDWKNDTCIENLECTPEGNQLDIWEDCSADSVLFTAKDPGYLKAPDCDILTVSDTSVELARNIDAEVDNSPRIICTFTADDIITVFYVFDINEFGPEPVNGNRVTEASVEENLQNDSFAVFEYIDQDYKETMGLSVELITEEFEHFSFTVEYSDQEDKVTIKVGTEELDYETRMFYKLEFNIVSTDPKAVTRNATHTVLLSVEDVGDNPPSWVQTVYSQNFPEGEAGRSVFTVNAVDRDININNPIQYTISKGNDADYFKIYALSGEVTSIKEIDREELETDGNTFFALEITAQEYTGENPAPEPSSSTTTTNVYITDINNKIPTFNALSYVIEIPELTGQSAHLDIEIFVYDMDEGTNGQFVITSDHPDDLEILPDDTRLNATLSLTALWREGTIFDYESTQDPIIILVTATEKEDSSHSSIVTLTITLQDENDNTPVFTSAEYKVDVEETQAQGFEVVTVEANDDDISEEYGQASIRYYLPSCPALNIDEMTGEITLARDNSLNFEESQEVTCAVEAHDNNNTMPSRIGYSTIVIKVIDVVDSPPELLGLPSDLEILENSISGTELSKTVTAKDDDKDADILFMINWDKSVATNQSLTVPIDLVREWFVIDLVNTKAADYTAIVKVGTASPDREIADLVTLAIEVIDNNTQVNANNDTGMLPIVILDENDCIPQFVGSYGDLEVKENVLGGSLITKMEIFDPDLQDTFTFMISDNSLVDVTQSEGDPKTADLRVSADANIDRESMQNISVVITVKDAEEQESHLPIYIMVIDLNDNPPIMNEGVCGKEYNISEVSALETYDDVATQNGTHVWDFVASDLDVGVEHSTSTYILINELQPGNKDRRLPFKIDKDTGALTVFLDPSQNKILDREEPQGDFWELYVRAYDNCATEEVDCEPKNSDLCSLYINVMDVNDNSPTDFKWSSYPANIVVNEFLKAGEPAVDGFNQDYEILASDLDAIGTNNTKLTYTVLSVNKVGDEEDYGLFKAVDRSRLLGGGDTLYYCILEAAKNFTELKGAYEIHIKAEDFGSPRLNGTAVIPLTIEDANDNTPEFRYYGCLDPDRTVTMAENYYQNGAVVKCTTPSEGDPEPDPLIIQVIDDDEVLNKEVEVSIDYENSTVEPPSVGVGQKESFKIRLKPGTTNSYEIYVASSIDKERGSLYNLSVHVIDKGSPRLESWSWIEIIVTNVFETPPYFCVDEEYCNQTIHITESDPAATAVFAAATDLDNTGVDPSDISNYDPVYYSIVGGSKSLFRLSSISETVLEVTQPLDRESEDTYMLFIDTFNEGQGGGFPISNPMPRNYTLYVTIKVDDVNDNPPVFPNDVILGSFTENDEKGNPVAFLMANDMDVNETLTYSLEADFEWVDGGPIDPPTTPFTIQQGENNTATIFLNFDPTGINSGYCNFTVVCKDNDDTNTGTTQVKIYAITVDFLLPVYFANTEQEVQAVKPNIEIIFGDVYGYPCSVDSIVGNEVVEDSKNANIPSSREGTDATVTVKMHFIDEENDEPVATAIIIEATNNDWVVNQLYTRLSAIGLNLISIGDESIDLGNNSAGEVLMLQILLAVVSFVLLSLVVLLMIAYCVRTRKLERQVKVLSTNTFGSRSSELNRIGTEMVAVPGSNKFLGEGSNPIYNLPDDDMRNDDGDSVSSGDSVLVGVEENPEFQGFGTSEINNTRSYDNAAFSRSIDQVSAPAGFSGGTRSNPLLEMREGNGDDVDLTDALQNYNVFMRHGSSGSEEELGSNNLNDAFSF